MKYIKYFESINNYTWQFLYDEDVVGHRFIKYKAIVDNVEYDVEFVSTKNDNRFIRNFEIDIEFAKRIKIDRGDIIDIYKPNPFMVYKCMAKITEDFIKKYNPESIRIEHIGKSSHGELSQRAKLSWRYLKDITNYQIRFYPSKNATMCYLFRPDIKISDRPGLIKP